jgi:hypothetical protein
MASVTFIEMKRMRLGLLALLIASAPLTARAQQSSVEKQAQALQVEGLHLMQKGDNQKALEKFDEAYRLVQSPRILFNRGKAHHALGEEVEALADFERFLDEAPFAPKESREEARRVIESVRPKLAYIEIQTDDTGSEITVDLHDVGTAPLSRPVVVTRGKHEIRIAKPGMSEEVRSVSVIPGQKLRVVIKMAPVAEKTPAPPPVAEPAPAAATPALAATEPGTAAASVTKPAESPLPPPPAERPWQITGGWVAAGASALFLGAGITAQVMASSKYADFNAVKTASGADQCNKMLPNNGGGSCSELLSAGDDRKMFAIIGYVAAGVAVATSAVLFLTAPSQSTTRREVAGGCSPSTAGVSCALELTF